MSNESEKIIDTETENIFGADAPETTNVAVAGAGQSSEYVVVARRYRPQGFEDLIGQGHVAQALSNAIGTGRTGHAYLFTGARGVGKTSAARIFAKALNCVEGPTATPCHKCDVCVSVSLGEDIDVLEIDGASNRGIDEIRAIRENVSIRPARARFKIYIIDEVHMLTSQAFNALLKTLEEPPEHVKFIFCTTEPNKLPITILSRCQRFDFVGIETSAIAARLREIVDNEGVAADDEALQLLARKAAGSMRDSQSLLEQLLSFCSEKLTLEDIHSLLGTTGETRLEELVRAMAERDITKLVTSLAEAVRGGADPASVIEQLFGYFRDSLLAASGCKSELFRYASPSHHDYVAEIGKQFGTTKILAILQIIDQTLSRMKVSTHDLILAETALIRIAAMEDFEELAKLIAKLEGAPMTPPGSSPPGPPRGNAPSGATPPFVPRQADTVAPSPSVPPAAPPPQSSPEPPPSSVPSPSVPTAGKLAFSQSNARTIWEQALNLLPEHIADKARSFVNVQATPPETLLVVLRYDVGFFKSLLEKPETTGQINQVLSQLTDESLQVKFVLADPPPEALQQQSRPRQEVPQAKLKMDAMQEPFIQEASELFKLDIDRVEKRS